jgi:hypothetical protein
MEGEGVTSRLRRLSRSEREAEMNAPQCSFGALISTSLSDREGPVKPGRSTPFV